MYPFENTLFNACPGGFCSYVQRYSEVLLVLLVLEALFFLITLFPPLFTWNNKKPDGKSRVLFAALACFTFYFWLIFLALNSIYCFGFLAHQGPCKHKVAGGNHTASTSFPSISPFILQSDPGGTATFSAASGQSKQGDAAPNEHDADVSPPSINTSSSSSDASSTSSGGDLVTDAAHTEGVASPASIADSPTEMSSSLSPTDEGDSSLPSPASLIWRTVNDSCSKPISEHEADLRNLTVVNFLIIVLLLIVLIANAKEALSAKALHFKETLCKKEEVQKFITNLVTKPPEVGHYVSCFHPAKTPDVHTLSTRKVVTFSAIENFEFDSWRDFSNLQLIDPSVTYPIMEVQIVLNFFPGDHYTAERYKAFVMQLTKEHSGKDSRINIDDYFHIEDHREWTFFVGNSEFISPWWDHGFAKVLLSCAFLLGWPFRLNYGGQIAKHQVEVKKAVFCEMNGALADEGVVSLTATPGSAKQEPANASSAPGKEASNQASAKDLDSVKELDDTADAAAGDETTAVKADEDKLLEQPQSFTEAPPAIAASGAGSVNNNVAKAEHASNPGPGAMVGAMASHKLSNNPSSSASHAHNVGQPAAAAVITHHPPPASAAGAAMPGHAGLGLHDAASSNRPAHIQPQPQPQPQQPHLHQHQPQYQQMNARMAASSGSYRSQQHQGRAAAAASASLPLSNIGDSGPLPPLRSVPLTSPRTQLREATRDMVTAVTHQERAETDQKLEFKECRRALHNWAGLDLYVD